jgi:hypothetical protein
MYDAIPKYRFMYIYLTATLGNGLDTHT